MTQAVIISGLHGINFYMPKLFGDHTAEFDNLATLKELYVYVNKYYGDIVSNLDKNPAARKIHCLVRVPST